jgi:hypothetical protein
MSISISRRGFLGSVPAVPLLFSSQAPATAPAAGFPAHEPGVVREVVGASHANLARVKELVTERPALARVSWDWGYGDWESPIDAASHVGNRAIADFLLGHGARPTIFTAAMMGQLAIVKGWVETVPGVQRRRGPHGLTLLHHARAGGAAAADVLKYLEALADADPRYTDAPLTDAESAAIAGDYKYGNGATERLTIAKNARGLLTISRLGGNQQILFHQGGLVFNPAGAEAVKIRFDVSGGKAESLIVEDGSLVVRATRL